MPDHSPSVRVMESPDKQKTEDGRHQLLRGKTPVWATPLFGHDVANSCFSRVVGAIGAQLSQLSKLGDAMDLTHSSWPFYLSTEFVQDLSIITACIPYIRNIIVGLESGMMQTGHFHLHKTTPVVSTDQGSHTPTEGSHDRSGPTTRTRDNDSIRRKNLEAENALSSRPGGLLVTHTTRVEAPPNKEIWDSESQSSRRDMITKTSGWNVQYHN